jgi:hypothetical protein
METDSRSTSERPDQRDRMTEALKLLLPETLSTLADLANAPTSIASAVVQLLPLGSRTALEDLEIVTADSEGSGGMELTPFGFDVIDAAAKLQASDDPGVVDMAARWEAAVSGYEVNNW